MYKYLLARLGNTAFWKWIESRPTCASPSNILTVTIAEYPMFAANGVSRVKTDVKNMPHPNIFFPPYLKNSNHLHHRQICRETAFVLKVVLMMLSFHWREISPQVSLWVAQLCLTNQKIRIKRTELWSHVGSICLLKLYNLVKFATSTSTKIHHLALHWAVLSLQAPYIKLSAVHVHLKIIVN